MFYEYKAKNKKGKERSGKIQAKSRMALARKLRKDGYYLLEIKQVEGDAEESKDFSLKNITQFDLSIFWEKVKGVPLEEKMMFSRNLSVMISSGISLTRGLEVLEEQTESPMFKGIISNIGRDIKKGKNFGDSLEKYSGTFGRLYSSMVKAGEKAGNLDETLNVLANHLEKRHELVSRIKSALMYPAVIVVAMTGIGFLMMVTVVPKLQSVFQDLGIELPLTTRTIIAFSNFARDFWWLLLLSIPFIVYGLKKIYDTEWGKNIVSTIMLKLPLFKDLVKKINNANFARTLSSLTSGGVPMLESLHITSDTLGNIYYRRSLRDAAKEVKKGKKLYEALEQSSELYTPLVIEMVQVGEESGKVSELLERVAGFYEEEVSDKTENLSSLIEPILMVLIGGAVGFFAVSVIQPMYGMLGSL